jgi:hypothetical protein
MTSSDPHLRDMITIGLAQWEQREPGHFEGYLVAHCGDTTRGVYVHTLTATGIGTGWVENRALGGKTADAVVEALKDIQRSWPLPIKSIDFDYATEFLILKGISSVWKKASHLLEAVPTRGMITFT